MKIAYFDCSSGISGDMCLGALVNAGVPLEEIAGYLKKLHLKGVTLSAKRVRRGGFSATKVNLSQETKVRIDTSKAGHWKEVKDIIKSSGLPDNIKQKGLAVFRTLFRAEAIVHGESIYKVHLHELGTIDCMFDILGTLIGLDLLKIDKIYASPINLGGGSVRTAHGILPVPAPATLEILKGIPVFSSGIPHELTTPTGAVIIKSISEGFGSMPCIIPLETGIGAGSKELVRSPNILRIITGEPYKNTTDEPVVVLETNIDDMNPQIYEYLIEMLFSKGALDVHLTQVIMKKARPGIKLSVLCNKDKLSGLIRIILNETTSIGLRYYETSRVTMDREIRAVNTKYGKVAFKRSSYMDLITKYSPEYEDCRKLAKKHGIPLLEVIDEAKRHSGGK